ncbi:MAG TPA: hypothetical protein VLF69_00985 [Candidatus Saccharimonadales bacterium]|nr:hypothetical protein [Candidatus Saccharimonadales bacterium]
MRKYNQPDSNWQTTPPARIDRVTGEVADLTSPWYSGPEPRMEADAHLWQPRPRTVAVVGPAAVAGVAATEAMGAVSTFGA